MKRLVLLLGLCAACSEKQAPQATPQAPVNVPAHRDVAQAAVARLEKELGALVAPTGGDEDLPEHVAGLLETIPAADAGLANVAREELFGLAPHSLPLLAAWLDDAERPGGQRIAAIEAIGHADTRWAGEMLLKRIEAMRERKNDEGWVRAHCAWRLGQGTQDWTVPRMIRHLRYETDHETVIWMVRALAKFGNLSGLDALYVIRRDGKTQELRDSANLALYEIARERGFEEPDALSRAWHAGDEKLADPELSPAHQLEIWRVIAGFREWQLRGVDDGRFTLARENRSAAKLLAEALSDSDRYIRTHAAQSLERMGHRARSAGPALLAQADDPQAAIFVLEALGGVGHEPAEAALLARLEPTYTLEVRTAAARGLASLGLKSSCPKLEAFAAEGNPRDLRFACACARLRCSPADAPAALVRFVTDDYASGIGETASSEVALGAWLFALDPAVHGERHKAWTAAASEGPTARVPTRSALLRAALQP
ncbi:MAG: HEAT repeat domain-containing protein [Planctomycetota bacterium]|nr:HEAT repeat domain-containing protein [Planctomycetota bacterium]